MITAEIAEIIPFIELVLTKGAHPSESVQILKLHTFVWQHRTIGSILRHKFTRHDLQPFLVLLYWSHSDTKY